MTHKVALGVEEEFHVVDLVSRRLTPQAHVVLDGLPEAGFSAELQRAVVETNSEPTTDLATLRAGLVDLRRRLIASAEPHGLGIASAGTSPLHGASGFVITADDRYQYLHDTYQFIAREQLICGAQVHVDIDDRDLAVLVAQRVEPWLPALLALSASSPYWFEADSGYASSRAVAWQRWPTAGMVGPFAGAAEYDQAVADLVTSGVIDDAGMVYFDIRLSAHVPTMELRICDACPLVDDVILLAGLFRALVVRETAAIQAGSPPRGDIRPTLLRAGHWRAARSGLEGDLISPVDGKPVPAPGLIEWLLEDLRPTLEQLDDWPTIAGLAADALARGSSAARQRAAFNKRGQLSDVVDLLLKETAGD
ncbi:putative glutamate--cysteine ligase 2-2 [Acrocarpospora pleiomorpha]|uniref:Putative glutamate--cysteine ligase 2 n=1 Tax=Acrocarpospora pleiomorpha TaxID=90975 RepID=A0A5M3XWB3_9ACTN|nr:glutamate--cysteine ligase [Acrocarpospora pleiomorpha]GES22618.1 putative glutamate--cysteine ligase 2-2 [Acrocarpospora pleiomorpha]